MTITADTNQLLREQWVARQRKKRRRDLLLGTLRQCPAAREAVHGIAAECSLELFVGDNRATRAALKRAVRQLPFCERKTVPQRRPLVVSRPSKVLREPRRPTVVPGLVEPEPPAKSQAPMTTILDELGAHLRVGVHRYWALDWLHSTTGLDWPHCSEILRNLGFPVDEGAIAMIMAARTFWDRLAEFRRIHTNAVHLGEVEAAVGTWAFVESSELPAWLPGLEVPLMHRRATYLVRLVPCWRPFLDLDFHGLPSYRPLFTVPL